MAFGNPQSITYTGVNITFAAAGGFESVAGGYRRFLWVKNGSGVSTTITVAVPGTTFEQNNPDVAVNIAAGTEALIGPLVPELDIGNGTLFFTVSSTTSVTGAFVDLPTPPSDLP